MTLKGSLSSGNEEVPPKKMMPSENSASRPRTCQEEADMLLSLLTCLFQSLKRCSPGRKGQPVVKSRLGVALR